MVSKASHWLLMTGLSLLKGARAGYRVLIGTSDTSKELGRLQETSYKYKENSLRQLHMGGKKAHARAPLNLTGALAPGAPLAKSMGEDMGWSGGLSGERCDSAKRTKGGVA